jgi:hypothetical protein
VDLQSLGAARDCTERLFAEILRSDLLSGQVVARMEQGVPAHDFQTTTFTSPTFCKVCKKLLWGLKNQGKCCKTCHVAVHPKCQAQYQTQCARPSFELHSSNSSNGGEETTCAHSYRVYTWTKPAFCHVCEQFLWGLAKQGLRCDHCHRRTHRKCLKAARHLPCSDSAVEAEESISASGHIQLDNGIIETLQTEGYSGADVVASMYTLMDAGLPINVEAVRSVLENRKKRGVECESMEEEDDALLCCVCLERPRDSLLMPCKHLCLCQNCHFPECPICRTPVEYRIDGVYL